MATSTSDISGELVQTENFVQAVQTEQEMLANGYDEDLLQLIKAAWLDLSREIPDPEILLSRDGKPVCTRGNFSYLVGNPGTKKTFLCSAMAGAYLNGGYMGFETPNGTGKVLWIDTEQADGHVSRIGKRVHRIANKPTDMNDADFSIYMLREHTPKTRAKILECIINLYNPDLVVLDGVADCINDSNDLAQSTAIVNDLLRITKEKNIHILTVIHSNIGYEKERGHLGSEARRKAETVITLTKNEETTNCEWTKTRDESPSPFAFMISDNGLPELTGYVPKVVNIKLAPSVTDARLAEKIKKVMPADGSAIATRELIIALNKIDEASRPTHNRTIQSALDLGYIIRPKRGAYCLPNKESEENVQELPF